MFGAIGAILGTIGLVATAGVTIFGFIQARGFTRRKLRFVEAAQSPLAPVLAGVVAAVVAAPVVALLPFVGTGTALLFGAGVGAGVLAGKQDIIRGRLNP
ncbi:MAG TPA: hypothetical protein VFR81_17920 [Longimicrobium sp.]|nr:hypothetical protein [Longimicrobium sp.]